MGGGWAAGAGLYLLIGWFGVFIRVQELLVIGLDNPRGPKRRLTNTGMNIRPIPPI